MCIDRRGLKEKYETCHHERIQYEAIVVSVELSQRDILNELSKMILSGQVEKDNEITIDEQEGKLLFRNE